MKEEIRHSIAKILKETSGMDIIRTKCGKTLKQYNYGHTEDRVNCPKCLAVNFPSNEYTIATDKTFTCFYCGRSTPDKDHEFDHKIPRSRGGRDILANLVDSCRTCNRAKSDMTAQEFLRTFQ